MRIILIALLLVVGHANADEQIISVQHDSQRGVTCWILNNAGISCLPDNQFQATSTPDQRRDKPTPVDSPTASKNNERFQL